MAVKQGDIVEKDQVIYYLEESESDELTKAEQELEDLELNYMKGLFGANVSPEVITKVANGNIDSFSQLQAKVTDMQNRLEAAKKRVEECQKNVDDLTLQSTKDTNNAGVSTKNEELTKDQATTDLTEAQNRFEKDKAATIASLNAQITEVNSQIADLEKLLSNAEASAGSGTTTGSTSSSSYDGQRKKAIESLKKTVNVILKGLSKPELVDAGLTEIENAYKDVYDAIKDNKDYQTLIADYNATHMLIDNIEQNAKDVNNLYANNQTLLSKKKADLANLQKKLAEVQAITASSDGGVQDAQNRLNQANRNILEITTANSQTSVAWQNRLADANAARCV